MPDASHHAGDRARDGDVCTVTVNADVFEWLTRASDAPNLEGEARDLKVARFPRTGLRYIGEGVCRVCGLVVPISKTTRKTVAHWPDRSEFAYYGNPTYYCAGSNEDAGEILGPVQRLTVYTIEWDEENPAEIERLSRAWAAKISEKPVVAKVNVRTFNVRGDHDV